MTFELQDFNELFENKSQEGLYLEFKSGAALVREGDARKELVKDCLGFANANGGTIVYGVAEVEVDGNKVAGSVSPVSSGLGKDWISEVLRNKTSPPLSRFQVIEIALPENGGRVVVVEIEPSSTAHQSLFDFRYYQRAGAVTGPMADFQIRDVMNRRSRPEVDVALEMVPNVQSTNFHRYFLRVVTTNIGTVTLEKWWFELDLPAQILRDTRSENTSLMTMLPGYHQVVRQTTDKQRQIARIAFGDPHWSGGSKVLHPGQSLEFDGAISGYPTICVELNNAVWSQLDRVSQPIPWRMYMRNAKPLEGEWTFEEWCKF